MMTESEITLPAGLITALRTARHIAVLTGSGVSAESGIPTFREAQTGLWAQYDPQELATPQAFRRNPRLVWEWYTWRRELVAQAAPNTGHLALAELERRAPQFTLITQNVDGLHQQAGNTQVIELHGNIRRTLCFDEGIEIADWPETDAIPPHCPRCNGLLRPGVVWFGEALPGEALQTAWEAAQTCDVMLSVGTSGVVEPAASLPRVALQAGASVGVINLDVTTSAAPPLFRINGPAGKVLPALVRAVWPGDDRYG